MNPANSPEHKAIEWHDYNERPDNADWSYERWSSNYHGRMGNTRRANEDVKRYADEVDWGDGFEPTTEVTVHIPNGGVRRLDVADAIERRGAEVKSYVTGKVYNTSFIISEYTRDGALITGSQWNIDWVFLNCEPSGPLRDALEELGINIILEVDY